MTLIEQLEAATAELVRVTASLRAAVAEHKRLHTPTPHSKFWVRILRL